MRATRDVRASRRRRHPRERRRGVTVTAPIASVGACADGQTDRRENRLEPSATRAARRPPTERRRRPEARSKRRSRATRESRALGGQGVPCASRGSSARFVTRDVLQSDGGPGRLTKGRDSGHEEKRESSPNLESRPVKLKVKMTPKMPLELIGVTGETALPKLGPKVSKERPFVLQCRHPRKRHTPKSQRPSRRPAAPGGVARETEVSGKKSFFFCL